MLKLCRPSHMFVQPSAEFDPPWHQKYASCHISHIIWQNAHSYACCFAELQTVFRAVSGGAVHVSGEASASTTGTSSIGIGILYIAYSDFTDNQVNASYSDGWSSSSSTAATTYGTLLGSGGVINFIGAWLWVQHSTFTSNAASTLGGALMFQRSCPPVSLILQQNHR